MKDFFISYNKADLSWAEWIAWQLEENGYTTVIQAWDFRPSSNFVLDMQKAAVEATRTIAVVSPDYLTSLYTQPEWAAAFVQDPTGEKGTLLPVRVRECEIKGLLSPIVYIDLVNLQEDSAKESLLKGVIIGRAKPAQPPAFPGKTPRTIAKKPRFPGSMPNIWNIQHGRNPNFTGREEILSALRQSLDAGQATALTQGQAIHGLGGVGKTQLAIEYAYRHCADYEIVWWMRSEEPTTLAGDYASLAMKLDLPEKEAQEQRLIVTAVKEWLRLNNGWLLIFDNANDSESVREYIPQGNTGRILVTSRNSNWRGLIKPLAVQKMEPDEAKTFLVNRTGQTDEANASALAKQLGYLPLALEQAGAFIETSGCTLLHYLKLFQTRQQEMLKRGKPSTEYPDTVATTWGMSFQLVEQKSQAAADLMKLCAFFAPDDISLEMLSKGAEHLPEPLATTAADTLALDEAIEALRTYSLVERKDESLSIHRLVQAVMRHRMSEEEFKSWAEAAISVVDKSFPNESEDVRTWSVILHLLPHAASVSEYAEIINSKTKNASRLLNQLGIYFRNRADYAQAKSFHQRGLAINEKVYGKNHLSVATRVNNLGLVLQDLGDLQGAKAHFERALAINEEAFDKNHPNIATIVNNLGLVLQDLGDLKGAKQYLERALAIDEATFGKHHPNVARDVNNLGMVLQDLGDLEGARQYLERALSIIRAFLGDEHPTTKIVRGNLESLGK